MANHASRRNGPHAGRCETSDEGHRASTRKDLLIFTSAALEHDLEVTGPVEVKLYAAPAPRIPISSPA